MSATRELSASSGSAVGGLFRRLRNALAVRKLPQDVWHARHRGIVILLALHAVALPVYGIVRDFSAFHAVLEGGIVAALALGAAWQTLPRRARSALASIGLVSSSAILVHFSGGYIEAHFHFFVMLGVILLYQDWLAYAIAVAYVALHHGVAGMIDPSAVFNHPGGAADPWLWASIHATFVLGLSLAHMVAWRAMDRAVAAREGAERALAETERRQREIIEHSSNLFYSHTPDHQLTYVSPQVRRFLGCHPDEALQRWTQFATDHPTNAEGIARTLRAIETGEPQPPYELELQRADGQRIWVEVSEAPVVEDGRTVAIVGALTDVTERKRAEEELARGRERLQEIEHLKQMDAFKTQFINAAAHELNTPLTPMRMQLHLLRSDPEQRLTAAQTRSLEILGRNFARYERLVQDLLSASRFQAGKLGISREPTDVARVVADAVKPYEDLARAAGVSIQTSAASDLHVLGDVQRLTQVMDNLLANALRFTPAGGTVHVEAAKARGAVVVSVKDSGLGLDPNLVPKLFQPFTQIHEPTKARGGSGLGLYICRGIVELHGGKIWCESDGPGKGARFAFTIPGDG